MPTLAKLQSESSSIHAQPQSSLLSLPYELRALIYEAVFSYNVIHLSTIREDDTDRRIERVSHTWCIEHWDARSNYAHVACSMYPICAGHLLGLPLTCRRVYLETIQVLYAQHTFSMSDEHAHTFWTFYRKTPMGHLNALRFLRLINTLVLPKRLLNSRVYPIAKSQYIGAWEAIAGLPNLQSLLVTSTYGLFMSRDDLMQNTDFITPMKVVQQRGLKYFDVVLHVTQVFFPRTVQNTLRDRKLLWETFEIETGGSNGPAAGLWEGMHPVCRLIAINVVMKHAPVRRRRLAERDLMAWIEQFGSAPSGLGFNGLNVKDGVKMLRLYERPWLEARNKTQGSSQGAVKATEEVAMNAVIEKSQRSRVACELQAGDLRDINGAVDLASSDRTVKYLYKYPELPEGEGEPRVKYLIGA